MTTEPDTVEETEAAGEVALASVIRRGLAQSPELRVGWRYTVGLALLVSVGRLIIPVSIQQTLDRGILSPDGYRPGLVALLVLASAVLAVGVALLNRVTYLRLVRTAEQALRNLRVRTFDHIHQFSAQQLSESRRGVLVARVTSDIETLAQFVQWGAISWIVNSAVVMMTLGIMALYSWKLAVMTLLIFLPVIPLLRVVQRFQVRAYDHLRATVGESLSEISEAVTGAAVIRSYHTNAMTQRRLHRAVARQYRAQMRAAWYFALMFPISDVFGALALGANLGVGVWFSQRSGISPGELVACLFLCGLILQPIGEIGEVLDQTQTAIAGWKRVLGILDEPPELAYRSDGRALPDGALGCELSGVSFAYDQRTQVLRDIDLLIVAGTKVAIVGETGSGKTTIAKLLCRLADPTAGKVLIGGVDLREVSERELTRRIRLVPQDGFLFDDTLGVNLGVGADDVTEERIVGALGDLGLADWVAAMPDGLDTMVGERGENLSVGERQFVGLVRAQLGRPGLLILDEATSSVDPESERHLSDAMARLARGRTVVTIAHRISTAMNADLVVVVDRGRVVELGTHAELVTLGGTYAALYDSWVSNTASNMS